MAGSAVRISILANGTQARRELGQTTSAAERMGKAFKSAGKIAALGVAGVAAGLTVFAAESLKSVQRIERIGKQTDAVLKSTGNVANTSRKKIDELAGSLELMTATEAESITEGANFLLTFTNIRNEVGKNNDIFDQAVVAMTDLSRAMDNTGGVVLDTRKQALLLGKALNDPIKGISALQRVGVSFTQQQKDTVTALVESGDTMKAQKLILAELTKQFGGSGEAFAQTTTGKIELAKHELGTLGETIVGITLPALGDLADKGTKSLQWMTGFAESDIIPGLEKLADYLGENRDEIEDFGREIADHAVPYLKELGILARDTGERLIDMVEPTARVLNASLVPALKAMYDAGSAVLGFVNDLPGPVKDLGVQAGVAALVLPRLTASITATTVAMTRGTTAAVGYYAAIRYGAGHSAAAAAAAGKLGSAAKTAAGIGGMLALSSGLSEVSKEGTTMTGILKGAAGGAGIGAMFGPIGALIGAGAGVGLTALVGSFAETKEEAEAARLELLRTEGFKNAKEDADSLREALVGVSKAYGETTRAAVEASFTGEEGKLDADVKRLRDLGVSMDTIVSATLGQADAQKLVDRALAGNLDVLQARVDAAQEAFDLVKKGSREVVDQSGRVVGTQALSNDEVQIYKDDLAAAQSALEEATIAQETFGQRISETGNALEDNRRKLQAIAADLGITVKQYKQFPDKVRTDIEASGIRQTAGDALRLIGQYRGLQRFGRIRAVISAPGVDLTRKQVRDLGRQYKLQPKQVRTLLRLEGVEATTRGAKRAGDALKNTGKTKPDLSNFQRTFTRGVALVESSADKGARRVAETLRDNTRKAKADLGPFGVSVSAGLGPIRGIAAAGGRGIGSDLKSGIFVGFGGTATALANEARRAVRAAITAGRNEGKIRSPSRETMYLGSMLGKGLTEGLAKEEPKAKKGGRDLIAAALAGVADGTSGVDKAVGRVTKLIQKRIDLKDAQKERRREREVLKALDDEFKRLRRNAREQDKNSQALDRARDKYKQVIADAKSYAASIKDSFVNYGSVISLGQGTGFADSGQLVSQLNDRLTAARRFAQVIKQLSGSLNKTTLQQLIDAGVEGGLGTAEAILAGGAGAIRDINQLTAQIAAAGGGLGTAMSDKFKQAGIDAAAGLVAGLEKEQRKLDRAAERIGSSIVKAIKKELGIKSPSRAFRDIGRDSMAGLQIGLDDTHARRLGVGVGRNLETGVKDGIGRPTLTLGVNPGYMTNGYAQTVNINVSVASGADPVAVGRETVRHVDAYFKAGGRSTAKWGGG